MSLSTIRSQLSGMEKRLDDMDGRGDAIHYLWTVVDTDGINRVSAGNPHSMARSIVEIMVNDADGPGDAPRIYFDGVEQNLSHALPAITLDEVLGYE